MNTHKQSGMLGGKTAQYLSWTYKGIKIDSTGIAGQRWVFSKKGGATITRNSIPEIKKAINEYLKSSDIDMIVVKVKALSSTALPAYESDAASGMDLRASADFILYPKERKCIPCGVAIEIPHGYEGQVRSRSGIAAKYGIMVLNSPGTIDSDYRGELVAILVNTGTQEVVFKAGDRIAQLVIAPVVRAIIEQADELSASARGGCGLGSTGVK